MYAQLDETNDYAIDTPPTAFEPDATDVIVFQDLEENGSLEEANLVIEHIFNDISMLMQQQTLVSEAIGQKNFKKSLISQTVTLNNAVAIRQRLEHRYRAHRTLSLATETFHCGYDVVVALEAEQEVQKGVFQTMIDAIVKAFKWLWDKLASLFKTSVEDNSAKNTKLVDQVKTAEASNIAPEPSSEENVTLAALFPELDGVITAKEFNDKLVSALSNADKLIKMYDIVTYCIIFIKELGNNINRDPAFNFADSVQATEAKMNSALSSFATMTLDDAKAVGQEIPAGVQPDQLRGLHDFTRGGKFLLWIVDVNGVKHPKSALKTMPSKEGHRTFKVGSANELNDIAKKNIEVVKLLSDNIKRFEGITEAAKSFTTNILPQYLKETADKLESPNLTPEVRTNLMQAMKLFSGYAHDVAGLIQNITQALYRCGDAATTGDKFIVFSASKYNGKKTEEKA